MNCQRLLLIAPPHTGDSPGLQAAAGLAQALGAALRIVAFVYVESVEGLDTSDGEAKEAQIRMKGVHRRWLQAEADALNVRGLDVSFEILWEPRAAERLVHYALHHEADLIIKDTHSGASLRGKGLGALDWELLRISPVPVLFVKDAPNLQKLKCLAAVELGVESEADDAQNRAIVQTAQYLGSACKADSHVICVYDRSDNFASVLRETMHIPGYEERRHRFDELAEAEGIASQHRHYVAGDPANAISSYTERRGYGVLIVGPGNLHRTEDSIGRTVHRLLERPPCSVLVLKIAPSDEQSAVSSGLRDSAQTYQG